MALKAKIDKARELVSLTGCLPAGPWDWDAVWEPVYSGPYDEEPDRRLVGFEVTAPSKEGATRIAHTECQEQAEVIASIPEMARLLGELANELDRYQRAMSILGRELAVYGKFSCNSMAVYRVVHQTLEERDPRAAEWAEEPAEEDYAEGLVRFLLDEVEV